MPVCFHAYCGERCTCASEDLVLVPGAMFLCKENQGKNDNAILKHPRYTVSQFFLASIETSGSTLPLMVAETLEGEAWSHRSLGEQGGHCLGLGFLKKLPFSGLGQYEKDQFKSLWRRNGSMPWLWVFRCPICKYHIQWWLSWLRMSGLTMASWRFTLVCPVTHRAGCPRHNVTCCSSSMLEKILRVLFLMMA